MPSFLYILKGVYVMKNLEMIWEFQRLEARKTEVQKQARKVPGAAELKSLKSEIEVIQNEARELNREINDLKKVIGNAEDRLTDLREKYSRANNELYNGNQASRELEASQKNISVIKQKIGAEEDVILGFMENLEELNLKMRQKVKMLDERKDLFRNINKTYSEKKEAVSNELEYIEKQIASILEKIEPGELNELDKFNRRFADKCGVALLDNGICSGCHMALSFDQLKQIKTKQEQVYCDNCGRILLVK